MKIGFLFKVCVNLSLIFIDLTKAITAAASGWPQMRLCVLECTLQRFLKYFNLINITATFSSGVNYSEIGAVTLVNTQARWSGIRGCSAPGCNPAGAVMHVGGFCHCPGVKELKCCEQEEEWALGVTGRACDFTVLTWWWRDQSEGWWGSFHHWVPKAELSCLTAPASPRNEQDPAHRGWKRCKPAPMCSCVPGIALQLPRACPEQNQCLWSFVVPTIGCW